MLGLIRRYRELLTVAALLVLPLLLFLSGAKEPVHRNVLDRAVLTVFSPVQKAVVWTVEGAQDLWYGYLDLVHVRSEDLDLRRENLHLRGEVAKLEELRQENERLRRLLSFQQSVDRPVVVAPIIAIGESPALSRVVRIGKGVQDGVAEGQAVVTPEGVVGRIVAAGTGWADVMLLADPNSAIPVQVSRSRARATVRGSGALDEARLEHALRTDDLSEGDLLVTAGTAGVFPKGIPVGRATGVERKAYGLFQHAGVVPSVDLARLEEVVVLIGGDGAPAEGEGAGPADPAPEASAEGTP